jgi:hypothetical protein
MKSVIVDFIMSETPPGTPPANAPPIVHPHLGANLSPGRCSCGSVSFKRASELKPDRNAGIAASVMYECAACGEYRLGR